MRTESSQAKRENAHYLQSVVKSKEIEAIVDRKRKRGLSEEAVRSVGRREYKQRKVAEAGGQEGEGRGEMAVKRLSDSLLRKVWDLTQGTNLTFVYLCFGGTVLLLLTHHLPP